MRWALSFYIITDSVLGMTQIHTHVSTLPKVTYNNHGWFSNLKVIVNDTNGTETMFVIYLPEGTTLTQVREALNAVEVNDLRAKQQA